MTIIDETEITQNQSGITCRRDGDAFNPHEGHRHRELLEQIQASIQEVVELPDGYAFRFPSEAEQILILAEFITLERRCCLFFNFKLEIESNNGPLWLRLTGGEGVKEFLKDELRCRQP